MTNIPQGLLISGICKGVRSETSNGFTNNDLLIVTGSRENDLGQSEPIVQRVALFGNEMQNMIIKANASIDKHILINVTRLPAKRDLRDTFMRNSINRQSEVLVLAEK